MAQPQSVSQLLSQYDDFFSQQLEPYVIMKPNWMWIQTLRQNSFKPRAVRYSLRPTIGQELDKVVSTGILEQVMTSEWASPIVPVPKADESIRICSDYKITIN